MFPLKIINFNPYSRSLRPLLDFPLRLVEECISLPPAEEPA
jgi:hypothetical protein